MQRNINIARLNKELYRIHNAIVSKDLIVNVSSEVGDIVMISKSRYDSLIETLYLSSNADVKQSIIDGMESSRNDCVDAEHIDW